MYIVTSSTMTNHQTKGRTLTKNFEIQVQIPIANSEAGLRGLKK